ncbi:MAG: glycosyltransferase [Bacteroidales bacterium]|nr:glycosyltransferase [Bacteroidales bacterium]
MSVEREIKLSIIVPVYNRPDEVTELLESLSKQTDKGFEVLIMEGDSPNKCDHVCAQFADKVTVKHHFYPEYSRSQRRNKGMKLASGNYFLFFDSDCIIPPDYIAIVKRKLQEEYVDCYGGPDSAEQDFSDTQLAINYSMTSMMTTGGIRGGTKKVNKFLPRTFNMGFSKEVYEKVGGFKDIIGEDIDQSLRIREAGFKIKLIKEAFLYHKRKIDLKKFYNQVNTFGKARILLTTLHPGSFKIVYLLPTCFFLGNAALLLMAIISLITGLFHDCAFGRFWWIWLLPIVFYMIAIFFESLLKNKKVKIALLSILTSYIQLCGYGIGFLDELFTRRASKKSQETIYSQQ